jgi:F0F1-type ATP synthase assembly protein I
MSQEPAPQKPEQDTDRRPWLQYSVAGKAFIFPLLVLMGLGWLLDSWLGLFPGFTVLGAVSGFFIGLWILIRIEKRLVEQEQQRHHPHPTPSRGDGESPRNRRS